VQGNPAVLQAQLQLPRLTGSDYVECNVIDPSALLARHGDDRLESSGGVEPRIRHDKLAGLANQFALIRRDNELGRPVVANVIRPSVSIRHSHTITSVAAQLPRCSLSGEVNAFQPGSRSVFCSRSRGLTAGGRAGLGAQVRQSVPDDSMMMARAVSRTVLPESTELATSM